MWKAKVFKNGGSQAVRLPKACRLEGNEVYVKKTGNVVLLIPKKDPWASLVSSLKKFSDDFMDSRDQPRRQVRESL